MKNFLDYLAFDSDELFVPNDSLVIPDDLDIDPTRLYIIASKLSKMVDQMKELSRDHIVAELSLSDEPTSTIDGVSVTLSRTRNYEFPDDDFIDNWMTQLDEQKKRAKKLSDAISNRKSTLVEEGLAIEVEPTYKVTIR